MKKTLIINDCEKNNFYFCDTVEHCNIDIKENNFCFDDIILVVKKIIEYENKDFNQFVIKCPINCINYLSITLSFLFYTKELNIIICTDINSASEWVQKRDRGVGVALREHYYNGFSLLPITHSGNNFQKDNFHKSIPESVRGLLTDLSFETKNDSYNITFYESQMDQCTLENEKHNIFIIDSYQNGKISLPEEKLIKVAQSNPVFITGLNPAKGIDNNITYLHHNGIFFVSIFNKYQLFVLLKIIYEYADKELREKVTSLINYNFY